MITPVLLLSVLICALVAGFIAFFVLLPRKKDDNRFSKISAIATFMASVATIAVGIATVSVMTHEEIRDKLQNQPLYSVSISANYSTEKLAFDNEEFEINNEGKKTREKTEVRHYSILELTYTDTNKHAASVPTREEIEAQNRQEAAKAAANAAPQSFAPMNWSQLGSPQQPESAANAAKPAPKVTPPLWEHVKKK